jgi:hypothetical protein
VAALPSVRWLDLPEDKDYAAAQSFLGLLVAPDRLTGVIDDLRRAPLGSWLAKDILRSAGLPPWKPKQSTEVRAELKKIKAKKAVSPVLLVGGLRADLVIADGYHRVSAAFHVDEETPVPGRLLWLT